MSRCKVLVKRLVCIEDLGDVDVLFTDKTGTLTLGRIDYMRAIPTDGGNPELKRPGIGGDCGYWISTRGWSVRFVA
jgi:magnesium-transporting ATPase (P-type)